MVVWDLIVAVYKFTGLEFGYALVPIASLWHQQPHISFAT